jgi:hypothetical protein
MGMGLQIGRGCERRNSALEIFGLQYILFHNTHITLHGNGVASSMQLLLRGERGF